MNLDESKRLLVIAAHPDDEVLGCGGTLAKAVSLGVTIRVIFLGEGVSARFPVGQYDNQEYREQNKIRNQGALDALHFLGITDIHFNDSRYCCQFDTIPLLSLVKSIESHFQDFRPNILFTHNPNEVNIDHRLTYEAVEVACRPTSSVVPKEIFTFEIVCSGNWTFETTFKPNVFVDVEEYFQKKLEAWHFYKGENRPFPFPRSDEGLTTLAQFRGIMSGLKLAEAFRLVRKVC
jgi:LmbE family N-acetylglucosaminyl deacetylase